MKYRIIERKYNDGDVEYICQCKILFWWFQLKDTYRCSTLAKAEKFIAATIHKDKTIKEYEG